MRAIPTSAVAVSVRHSSSARAWAAWASGPSSSTAAPSSWRWASGRQPWFPRAVPGASPDASTRRPPSSATTCRATAPAGTSRLVPACAGCRARVALSVPATPGSGQAPLEASRRADTACSISGRGAIVAPRSSAPTARSAAEEPPPPRDSGRPMPGAPVSRRRSQAWLSTPDGSAARARSGPASEAKKSAKTPRSASWSAVRSRSTSRPYRRPATAPEPGPM